MPVHLSLETLLFRNSQQVSAWWRCVCNGIPNTTAIIFDCNTPTYLLFTPVIFLYMQRSRNWRIRFKENHMIYKFLVKCCFSVIVTLFLHYHMELQCEISESFSSLGKIWLPYCWIKLVESEIIQHTTRKTMFSHFSMKF